MRACICVHTHARMHVCVLIHEFAFANTAVYLHVQNKLYLRIPLYYTLCVTLHLYGNIQHVCTVATIHFCAPAVVYAVGTFCT